MLVCTGTDIEGMRKKESEKKQERKKPREKGERDKKEKGHMRHERCSSNVPEGGWGLQFDLPMFASHATLHMHNTIYTLHEQWGEQGESC